MKKFTLSNGLTVIHEPRKSDSITLEISVGTGSNNEEPAIAGMSHFLEHMIFEGTEKRTARQISQAIENIGGELNAATSNERTFFYIKVPKSKARIAFDILSDMIKNPALRTESLEKERKVVLEEIKMVNDQPLIYQWVLFEKALFKRHPTRNPVYGTKEAVRAVTRQKMLAYYSKWYLPQNMSLSIVGDTKNLRQVVQMYFGDLKRGPVAKPKTVKEPKDNKPTIKKEKKDTNQAYLLIGYKTVPRLHKDSCVLDVIASVFSKGLSGRINEEIRVKRGLAYSVGTHHESKKDYGFIVFHLNCDKKNLELCKRIVLGEIDKLSNLKTAELNAAKEHIAGRVSLNSEDSQKKADNLAFWEFIRDAKLADSYIKCVRKVSLQDIDRVRKRFLDGNYTMVVLSK